MALILVVIGSMLASIVNLMTKRNADAVGSPQGYLVIYFLFSLVSCFFVDPKIFSSEINWTIFCIGAVTGVLMFLMMIALPNSLHHGPPGLSFAFQNASSVMPTVLLFFIFGSSFEFQMSPMVIIGVICVIIGLVYSAYPGKGKMKQFKNPRKWSFYIISAFLLQGVILSIFHWRSMLINSDNEHPLLLINSSLEADIWFMPGVFTVTTFLNAIVFIFQRRWFKKPEVIYGSIGGFLNGVVTFLLLVATNKALGIQKSVLFPLFAVCVILFCSIWGQKLYKEKVNWIAILICILGVFLATI